MPTEVPSPTSLPEAHLLDHVPLRLSPLGYRVAALRQRLSAPKGPGAEVQPRTATAPVASEESRQEPTIIPMPGQEERRKLPDG